MSEQITEPNTSEQDGNATGGATSATGDEFKPITSQEDLNRVLEDRLRRERAKFADYRDVKAKASKLDEIEQANKSEIDKAMDRVTKAEAEVAQLPARVAEQLRTHLIGLHDINSDDAELFLTASDPQLLLKQVQRLVGRSSDRKKQGNVVPREGASSTPTESDERETVRALFG